MLNNYYLLHRLAHLWNESLLGAMVEDAWCHAPGELVIAFRHDKRDIAISFLTHMPIVGAFQRRQASRPRRNTKSLFPALRRQSVTAVKISTSDRILTLELTGGLQLQAHLYGGRSNIFLADKTARVLEAFRKGAPTELPQPRGAVEPQTLGEFQHQWDGLQMGMIKKLQRIYVRFNKDQAEEVINLQESPRPLTSGQVYEAAHRLHQRLIYAKGPLYIYHHPPTLSVIPLMVKVAEDAEVFTDIDEGVCVHAQRLLSERAYRAEYESLRKKLIRRLDKAERSADQMKRELNRPSRANEYESMGHLLMASPPFPAGKACKELEDIFHPGAKVTITLDPKLDSIQNAEKYYAKARKARISRSHLDALIDRAECTIDSLSQELQALEKTKTYKDLKGFQKTRVKPSSTGRPFRRYPLAPNYEVWVGRNAKESEALTLRHARPFDLWLHARGVTGAHTILRLPKRDATPSRYLIEQAAAIAAWHSKARTSSMAPVIVTPRKYVQKPRGAPLGEVSIMRESIVMVEPALP